MGKLTGPRRPWKSVLVVVGATMAGVWTFNRRRTKKLRLQRATYGRTEFLVDCDALGLSPGVAGIAWNWFIDYLGDAHFPIRPQDSLGVDLRMGDKQVDLSLRAIARRSGRRQPRMRDVFRRPAIRTVADVIAIVGSLPLEQTPASSTNSF